MKALLLAALAPIGAHGPKMTTMQGTDAALECSFASGVVCETAAGPDVSVTTTRAGGATCIGGHTVVANVPCIGTFGLESFASGTGGRTAADVHTVDASKWPTSSGRIDFIYTPSAATSATNRMLLHWRAPGSGGLQAYILTSGAIVFIGRDAAGATVFPRQSAVLTWEAGRAYRIRLVWTGTQSFLYRDDVEVAAGTQTAPMGGFPAVAHLGSEAGLNVADGSLKLLRVSP